ncbi:DNA-binding PucR family transcriptional regulator [Oikeobacillus pervagus]|uniref:DNA-binding PucR family transcriptional regulator n=1 Tax=Oikeobacillus pervagus TaxID=1325931 RepID=A0AAJ1T0T4_9BACI|nr:helix-turn-helix domain-containing protein [Oikeobacillus pervagus]MDQ0214646.1 DNA-binding PucR family transcriptional regulator [Oikeobacillus pervagus]
MIQDKANRFFTDHSASIDILADRISEKLECPITIEDANHRIIAYSRHEGEVDPVRIATIMRRRVPEQVINSLWKVGAIPKLFESGEPVVIPKIENVGLGERVAISVWKNKEVLGFIWAHATTTFSSEKMDILKESAKVVKQVLMKHQKNQRENDENYQEFFWKLLTGHITKWKDMEKECRHFDLNFDGVLAVIVFEFQDKLDPSIESQANYLIDNIQKIPVLCRTFESNQLILLTKLPTMDQQKQIDSFISHFTNKMGERLQSMSHVTGAVGGLYTKPSDIHQSFQEALYVLQMKQLFPHECEKMVSYDHLGVFQFIQTLYENKKKHHDRNLILEKLTQYDEQHRTNLLKTIEVFLQCDSNVNDAAKILHIHINTLSYRLKRISEIADFNLKDPNQKMNLYLHLLMSRMELSDL